MLLRGTRRTRRTESEGDRRGSEERGAGEAVEASRPHGPKNGHIFSPAHFLRMNGEKYHVILIVFFMNIQL